MNSANDKLGNVLGSVGIAALTVANLLVPYSDLNAGISPPPPPTCANKDCYGTVGEPIPVCSYNAVAEACDPTSCTCTGPDYAVYNEDEMLVCPANCVPDA